VMSATRAAASIEMASAPQRAKASPMMNPVNTRTKNASRILAHHRRLVDAGGSSMPFRRVAAGELMMAILCDRRMRSRPSARLRPVVVAGGISGGAVVDGRAGRGGWHNKHGVIP